MDNNQFLDILKQRGMLDEALTQEILNSIDISGESLSETLVDYEILSSNHDLWKIVATELGLEAVDLSGFAPPHDLLANLPAGLSRLHGAFPIASDGKTLTVALLDPLNPQTVEDLSFALGRDIKVAIAPANQVETQIDQHYGHDSSAIHEILTELDASLTDATNLENEANAAPIIKYVDLVLDQAVKEKASDIHFEPFEGDFKIRYRVDGALIEMAPPPASLALPIISRVKVMSNMNIAEKRVPQDGRIVKIIGEKQVDMRVSSLPTQYGESVVCRVLDRSSVSLDLKDLGLPEFVDSYIKTTVRKPNGIFLVTGPTGAGKTTTLYASLRDINTIDTKILTAEDPVEYDIDGIIQVPTNEAIDLNFAKILRAFLRQDPDKILVGEIRDLETAQIAIQASLTGHLVLSTLHTNDSAGTVTRLIDMGVEPFLAAASLEGILAQRLVRKICRECHTAYEPNEGILEQLELSPHEFGDKNFYTGKGCETCGESGYRGRQGLFELLDVTDPIKELITERAPTIVIKQKAIELGMGTLRQDGLRNIYGGVTTIEEVLKYT